MSSVIDLLKQQGICGHEGGESPEDKRPEEGEYVFRVVGVEQRSGITEGQIVAIFDYVVHSIAKVYSKEGIIEFNSDDDAVKTRRSFWIGVRPNAMRDMRGFHKEATGAVWFFLDEEDKKKAMNSGTLPDHYNGYPTMEDELAEAKGKVFYSRIVYGKTSGFFFNAIRSLGDVGHHLSDDNTIAVLADIGINVSVSPATNVQQATAPKPVTAPPIVQQREKTPAAGVSSPQGLRSLGSTTSNTTPPTPAASDEEETKAVAFDF